MKILSEIDTRELPSLLPYLESGPGRFHLKICQEPATEHLALNSSLDPFQFQDISDPFAVLGRASINSDLTEHIVQLDMLIQRSDYAYTQKEAPPLTNVSIDQRWQHILAILANPPLSTLTVFLAGQKGRQEQLLPFRPLFHCRARQSFFHPPCPLCTRDLALCTDDTLLTRHGLETYSGSLRRYLHCPQCGSEESTTAIFYVLQRIENDPEHVRDNQQLIRDWARLEPGVETGVSFPCHGCPGYKACFGNNTLAIDSLCSFSFYPFYLLLIRAESEISVHYKELASGQAQLPECYSAKHRPVAPPEESPLVNQNHNEQKPEPILSDPHLSDKAIHAILVDISKRWQGEPKTQQKPLSTEKRSPPTPEAANPHRDAHADLAETVILSPSPQGIPRPAENPEAMGIGHRDQAGAPHASGLTASVFQPADTQRIKQFQIDKKEVPEKQPLPARRHHLESTLQETIILSPPSGLINKSQLPGSPPLSGHRTSYSEMEKLPKQPPDKEKTMADPAETIIIRPGPKT